MAQCHEFSGKTCSSVQSKSVELWKIRAVSVQVIVFLVQENTLGFEVTYIPETIKIFARIINNYNQKLPQWSKIPMSFTEFHPCLFRNNSFGMSMSTSYSLFFEICRINLKLSQTQCKKIVS